MQTADALDRIYRLPSHAHELFDGRAQVASPRPSPLMLKNLLTALELRWRIEDVVLIPALHGTRGVMQDDSEDAACELAALRDLAALARDDALGLRGRRVLLRAIDALATLRSERLNRALVRAQRAALVDVDTLGREVDELLARWRDEALLSGEFEDETPDPVALSLN
jgi:hypothetical protein